jgi:hypothetical protein
MLFSASSGTRFTQTDGRLYLKKVFRQQRGKNRQDQ